MSLNYYYYHITDQRTLSIYLYIVKAVVTMENNALILNNRDPSIIFKAGVLARYDRGEAEEEKTTRSY